MNISQARGICAKLNIRKFDYSDLDYQAIVDLHNALWPDDRASVDSRKHRDNTWSKDHFFQRWVAERDGRTVAFAVCCHAAWAHKPGKYHIDCTVRPDAQKQGIGAAVYDHLMNELGPRNPTQLVSHIREDKTDAVAFMERRGFELVMRFPLSHLNVETFDFNRFAGVDAQMKSHGLEVKTIAQLQGEDPGWLRKMYDLVYEILRDVPSPDPITKEPFDLFEARVLGNPGFIPEAHFFALDGNRYVGYSALWKHDTQPERLNTGLSGVTHSHRRKGVCTALKVCGIRYAKANGVKLIETENEENNPMYQLNLQLGFEARPAWTNYVKYLKKADSGS